MLDIPVLQKEKPKSEHTLKGEVPDNNVKQVFLKHTNWFFSSENSSVVWMSALGDLCYLLEA